MTDCLFEASVETWIRCPYNKAHLVIKDEMLAHLENCREVWLKAMAAEGRPMENGFCKTWEHYVPKLELKIHDIICKKKKLFSYSDQSEEVSVQEADSSSSGSLLEEQQGEPSQEHANREDLEAESDCNTVGK